MPSSPARGGNGELLDEEEDFPSAPQPLRSAATKLMRHHKQKVSKSHAGQTKRFKSMPASSLTLHADRGSAHHSGQLPRVERRKLGD